MYTLLYSNPFRRSILLVLLLAALNFCGCKKFVEVDPPVISLNGGNVFTTDATAIAAVTAMYTRNGSATGAAFASNITSVSITAGLSADELTLVPGLTGLAQGLYANDLLPTAAPTIWELCYSLIYLTNSSIEGLNQSTSLTPGVKQQLLGESKFMRAFLYFYLGNLYGDVPLALTTDYRVNSLMARTPSADVWPQIIADLLEAKDLMNQLCWGRCYYKFANNREDKTQ
jgi:starch-binding outer membrane protein, SusD/RagB family